MQGIILFVRDDLDLFDLLNSEFGADLVTRDSEKEAILHLSGMPLIIYEVREELVYIDANEFEIIARLISGIKFRSFNVELVDRAVLGEFLARISSFEGLAAEIDDKIIRL